jgi:DNA-directed RNA polymerase subunit RPC12/RpoP
VSGLDEGRGDMASSTVEITCPRCGHKWTEDVEELKKQKQTVYRDFKPGPKVTSYRVQCPQCGTMVVVDIQEDADE